MSRGWRRWAARRLYLPARGVDVRLAVELVTLLADPVEPGKLGLVVDAETAKAGKAALEDAASLLAAAGTLQRRAGDLREGQQGQRGHEHQRWLT